MADLLRFVVALATEPEVRDRFRVDPAAVLSAEVDDAGDLTGEDVEAATAWALERLREAGDPCAQALRVVRPVRPVGNETPGDAALRILDELCTALDGLTESGTRPTVVEPPTLPPGPIATGGGEPVPDAPPALRGRRLWAIGGESSPTDMAHPVHGGHDPPALRAVPEPAGWARCEPLDLVRLLRGVPEARIEPGAVGTVVAVDDRGVEVEVVDHRGDRRFLGVVNPDDVVRVDG